MISRFDQRSRLRPRTQRARLALLTFLTLALIQVGICLVLYTWLAQRLDGMLDRELQACATLVRDTLVREQLDFGESNRPRLEAALVAQAPMDAVFELRDLTGGLIFRSPGPNYLRFDDPQQPYRPAAGFATLVRREPKVHSARVLTSELRTIGDQRCWLVVAMDRTEISDIVNDARFRVAALLAVSLALSGVVSWRIGSRSARPLETLALQARELSARKLHRRFRSDRAHSEEVADLVDAMNAMLDRLEVDFANQRRFMAEVSHELKTPLAVLLGEAQTLRKRDLPREAGVFVESVEAEARRLLRTVESFLILARIRAGERAPHFGAVEMEDVVLHAVQRSRAHAEEHGVRVIPHIRLDAEQGEAFPLNGDPELLASMVENLIHNGIRVSPNGERVEVELSRTSTSVIVRVRDRGPGVPDEKLRRIFDLFYQEERQGAGGIGLSIVREVARLHGGRVTAENRPSGGFDATVELPGNGREPT